MIARLRRSDWFLALVLSSLTTACLGGGGGGSGDAAGAGELRLDGAFYGRGLRTGQTLEIVSPLTLVRSDPLTGLDLPGTLEPVVPHGNTGALESLALSPDYRPMVIPRNGVLVLRFTRALDPGSVVADSLAPDGTIEQAGSVQLRDARGKGVPVLLYVTADTILIDPAVADRVGFPPSPLAFDAGGRALAHPDGTLRLSLPALGDRVLRSLDGTPLTHRRDELASPDRPIGINPGNSALDFIQENRLAEITETFNGFLPDRRPPRIMREYVSEGELTRGDSVSVNTLLIASASFDTRAHGGFGEWAGERLTVRAGEPDEEIHRVLFNSSRRLTLDGAFRKPPGLGDRWRLARAEFHEPDPEHPLDPDIYDPFNPQNSANQDLANFINFDEIDESGLVRDADGDGKIHYAAGEPIPGRAVLWVRFDEPIDVASCLPYESFRVEDDVAAAGDSGLRIGQVSDRDGGRVIEFWPRRALAGGDLTYPGFGPDTQPKRRFSIVTVPPLEFLRERIAPDKIGAFLARGVRSVTDLAGRPLAWATSEFDPQVIMIERSVSFEIVSDPAQVYPDVGGVVHRFQGTPEILDDPVSGKPGVAYHDHEGLYGLVPDINTSVPHQLSCASLVYDQRILDDRAGNRPPADDFSRFKKGLATPLNGVYGVRFQHLYRSQEASISRTGDLAGTFMDLFRISFAPIGGHVSGPDLYLDISVHAAHSDVVPVTTQTGGNPDDPQSGLGEAFDPASFDSGLCGSNDQQRANYLPPLEEVVPAGTDWTIDEGSIYGFAGTPYRYHPWPEFVQRFSYDNEHSLLLEYRIRPQSTPVSGQNGFTFSPAMKTSFYPRFRVFSLGDPGNLLDPDPTTPVDRRAYCASGPVNPGVFGDNSRYFYTFDYVKTTSVIVSPFVEAPGFGSGTAPGDAPHWLTPLIDPPPEDLLGPASVSLELRAADDPAVFEGLPDEGWTADPSLLQGRFIQFRLRVVVEPEAMLAPSFETILLPFER